LPNVLPVVHVHIWDFRVRSRRDAQIIFQEDHLHDLVQVLRLFGTKIRVVSRRSENELAELYWRRGFQVGEYRKAEKGTDRLHRATSFNLHSASKVSGEIRDGLNSSVSLSISIYQSANSFMVSRVIGNALNRIRSSRSASATMAQSSFSGQSVAKATSAFAVSHSKNRNMRNNSSGLFWLLPARSILNAFRSSHSTASSICGVVAESKDKNSGRCENHPRKKFEKYFLLTIFVSRPYLASTQAQTEDPDFLILPPPNLLLLLQLWVEGLSQGNVSTAPGAFL
jgi:hypothetical protein